jgi:hypothetical protein
MKIHRFAIEEFSQRIPSALLARSGKVFYSGRLAFAKPSTLYVMGVNPGGEPINHKTETVGTHTELVLHQHPDDWSAYRDESWGNHLPGSYGMAPRILHLFRNLNLAPGHVPCSNLVFARSRAESDMNAEMEPLADLCWPFHEFLIDQLKPRVVLCLGSKAGKYVKEKLAATEQIAEFREMNNRGWATRVFVNQAGLKVVVATHPSRVDWTSIATDPSPVIAESLK